MKSKALMVILVVVGLLAGGGGMAYSAMQAKASARTFSDGGYILTADADSSDKQLLFAGGTQWKDMPDERVLFKDVQGQKKEVTNQSFVHYSSRSLSALSNGVVVDLNDVSNAQMTNHYAVSSRILFEGSGDGYTLSNTAAEYQFRDFMWKLSENKYMIVSDEIELQLGDGEKRTVNNFVEVSYIDNGIIQFQTEDNLWQTVAPECMGELGNGEMVDFSSRNVQDPDGEVLLDFGKVVLDSEDNIEVIPLDDRLENVFESIIPHFNIKAEPGEDGEDGLEGNSGEDGQTGGAGAVGQDGIIGDNGDPGNPGDPGEAGAPGDPGSNGAAGAAGSGGASGAAGAAGANGAPGASGINGAGGAPGAPGNPGNPGKATEIEGKVLKFPVFNLEVPESSSGASAWTVSANGCKGNIMVEDEGVMLRSNSTELRSEVYLTDLSTSEIIYPEGYISSDLSLFEFSTLQAEGYPFEFKGLQPDHAYMLTVTAPIQTDAESETYSRAFITKTFWTDSTGIYMEPAESTLTSVSANIIRSYVVDGLKTGVLLFRNPEEAAAAPASGWEPVTSFDDPRVWDDLDPNTSYYARLAFDLDGDGTYERPGDQILELKTLKRTASVGAPTLTANRDNWGFDLIPGKVVDTDKGIIGYTYEFYAEGSVQTNGGKTSVIPGQAPVTTLHAEDASSFVVPMDGTVLIAGRTYYVRTIAEFNDNEKNYTITSELSNPCSVQGSQLPAVYYTPLSTEEGSQSAPSTTAPHYDEIIGTINVDPSSTGSKLLIDMDHIPTVTIRANGYYYVQYPVYTQTLADTLSVPANTYLLAEPKPGGKVEILLPQGAENAAHVTPQGRVNGLDDDMAYEIIVNGALTQDNSTAVEDNIEVGRCVVNTPKITPVQVTWPTVSAPESARFRFSAYDPNSDQFSRQMNTISSLTVTLYSGQKPEPGQEEAGTELGHVEFNLAADRDKVDSILSSEGLLIALEPTFGNVAGDYSVVHLTLSAALDYTNDETNRVNQTAVNKDPYINEFPLIDASVDISIGNQPDPIPDEGKGFDVLKPMDTDGDRDFNDSFILHPNYSNTARMATRVTYYVFDAVDFYNTYYSNNWKYDESKKGSTNVEYKTAVSVIGAETNTGAVPWLGSVTVNVDDQTGEIPQVNFIPMTREKYMTAHGLNESTITETDGDGNFYMFFNNGSYEPETGHQFVFAWTLWWADADLSGTATVVENFYPFDMNSYKTGVEAGTGGDGYLKIPHSEVVDVPKALPTVYALPWTSDDHTVTWKVYVSDPEDCIVEKEGAPGNAVLYERMSATVGEELKNNSAGIELPVHDQLLTDAADNTILSQVISSDNSWNVTISDDRVGSHAAALRVQRYTDKYTPEGLGLFKAGNYIEDSFDYAWNIYDSSTARQSSTEGYVIPWYANAFTYYVENNLPITQSDLYDVNNGAKVTVDIREADLAGAVNDYRVTVTGPRETLERANAVRFEISKEGVGTLTLDKVLNGKDVAIDDDGKPKPGSEMVSYPDADTMEINTRISIGDELVTSGLSFAGQNDVTIKAVLLYETNDIGYKSVKENTSAQKDYSLIAYNRSYNITDAGKPILDRSDRLVFSNAKTVTYQSGYKLGSVFNNLSLNGTGLSYASTRAGLYSSGYTEAYDIIPDNDWRTTRSGHVMVPCVLNAGNVYARMTYNGVGSGDSITLSVRKVTPQIEYINVETGVSNANVNYLVKGMTGDVYFTLEKSVAGEMYMYQYLEYFDGVYEPHEGSVSATTFLTVPTEGIFYPQAYGEPGADKQFNLATVLDNINNADAEQAAKGGKILSPKNIISGAQIINYEYLTAGINYYARCWYWDENKEWRDAEGNLVAKGGFAALNMQGQSGMIPNSQYFTTKDIPDVVLKPAENRRNFYSASAYSGKWLAAEVRVSNATNYYWTLELQEKNAETGDWEFSSWLGVGNANGVELSSSYAQFFDVDGASSNLAVSDQNLRYAIGTKSGDYIATIPQYKIGIKELTNKIETTSRPILSALLPEKADTAAKENLYLEYGTTYRLRARIYDLGSGPAFSDDYDLSTDPSNLLKLPQVTGESAEQRAAKQALVDAAVTKEFTVPGNTDYISIAGAEDSSESGSVISFTPGYTANSMYIVRQLRFAAVVIRSHTNGNMTEYYDVTHMLRYGNETGTWFENTSYPGIEGLNFRAPLYLDIPEACKDPSREDNWIGDSFTCYVYAIQDHVTEGASSGNTAVKYFGESDVRKKIMQGRPDVAYEKFLAGELTDTDRKNGVPITIAQLAKLSSDSDIPVPNETNPDGFSRLMSAATKEFRSDSVSAGNVFAVWDSSEKKIILQMVNMVNPDQIKRMRVDVTAEYDQADGSSGDDTWGDYMDLSLSGQSGTVNITPRFENMPSGANISSYLITVCFQYQETEGVYKNVPLYPTSEMGGTVSSDYHYTQPIDPNENAASESAPALMNAPLRMSVFMPPAGLEEAPAEQSGFLQSGGEITPLGTSEEPPAEVNTAPPAETAADPPSETPPLITTTGAAISLPEAAPGQ